MRVGIIGAGNIGGALTRRFTSLGHQVAVANSRAPETLRDLADETGAIAVSAENAPRDADLVVVTIPVKAIPYVDGRSLDTRAKGAPVIDTGNYYPPRDGRIAEIVEGTPSSVWVSQQLGQPLIKVFNTIVATHLLTLGKPAGDPDRIALPVAGDDAAAKANVTHLVDELGFDPVDAGPLAESWRQEPGTPCYGADLDAERLPAALAAASRERPV